MRRLALLLTLLAGPLLAQTPDDQTLADIRAELEMLERDIARLRQELTITSPATSEIADATPLIQRLNALEAETVRITADVEQLRLEVARIVRDGTNRIDDLQFRLTELEGGDLAALDAPEPLGTVEPDTEPATESSGPPTTVDVRPRTRGDTGPVPVPPVSETTTPPPDTTTQPPAETVPPPVEATPPPAETPPAPQLAINEQADFDAARAAYEAGDYVRAADLFSQFMQLYPGGPLNHEAAYWRGEALFAQAIWTEAARSYLDAFSGDPDGARAAESLYRLGTSLGRLGQVEEACLTLSEVFNRFPGVAPEIATGVTAERRTLGCP